MEQCSWRKSEAPAWTAPEQRRANKPLMEKRRRARINQSLAALKAILLAGRRGARPAKHKQAKLEKADILEMTVRHFQMTRTFEAAEVDKYAAGYGDCAKEVERFLSTPDVQTNTLPDVTDADIKAKLFKHLEGCIVEIDTNKEDENGSMLMNLEQNSFDLQSPDISINLLQEQMKNEIIRNMNKKQDEKENLFINSKHNALDYAMDMQEDIKQEPFENMLNESALYADNPILDHSQRMMENTDNNMRGNAFGQNALLSMIPTVTPDGQVLFLLPANTFGFNSYNNGSQFLMPFLTQLAKNNNNNNIIMDSKKSEIKSTQPAKKSARNVKQDKAAIIKREKKLFSYESDSDNEIKTNLIKNDQSSDEPIDFSMSSDMSKDPMWRPW